MPLPVFRSLSRCLLVTALILVLHGPGLWSHPAIAADLAPTNNRNSQTLTPYLNRAIQRITEFQLDNGLKFIVMENNEAPVVSFYTYFDVGAWTNQWGKRGWPTFWNTWRLRERNALALRILPRNNSCWIS
ncbi:hypothetical protein NON20_21200 [Synechocystis sp. B12]|nr:hypothetical protein NON20_21200 [Synechocystis sp. B12]